MTKMKLAVLSILVLTSGSWAAAKEQLNVAVKPIKKGSELEVLVRGTTAKKIFDHINVFAEPVIDLSEADAKKFTSEKIKRSPTVTCIEFVLAKTGNPDYSCAFSLNKKGDSKGILRKYDSGGLYSATKAEEVDDNDIRFYFYDSAALKLFGKMTAGKGNVFRDTSNISCSHYVSSVDHKDKGICTVDINVGS